MESKEEYATEIVCGLQRLKQLVALCTKMLLSPVLDGVCGCHSAWNSRLESWNGRNHRLAVVGAGASKSAYKLSSIPMMLRLGIGLGKRSTKVVLK